MRNYLLPILISLCWAYSYAQDPYTSATDGVGLPSVMPGSPEATSIAKYGDVPVNLSSGQLQFNVPLYSIKVGDFVLPISLSYSYSGLKVEEVPGRMGLGWTLNAGGVLNRQVRGLDDFFSNKGYHGSTKLGKNRVVPFMKNITLNSQQREEFVKNVTKGAWDSQPDKFTFKVGGESFSFFLNENEEPVFQPKKNYDVEIIDKSYTKLKIIITDDRGIKYHFTGDSDSENTLYESGDIVNSYLSARYISKIELPNSQTIEFEYEPFSYTMESLTQSERILVGPNTVTNYMKCSDLKQLFTETINSTTISGKLLKRIIYPEGEIVFDRQSTSQITDKNVKEIIVKDNNEKTIMKYGFSYSNLESTGHFFKLDSITKISSAKKGQHFYSFTYNGNVPQYSRNLQYSQDVWGYYNSNTNTDLIPDATYSNRKPDFNKSKAGALTKITYPTRGYTELEYEANKVHNTGGTMLNSWSSGGNTVDVGGIRIKKTLDYAHSTAQPVETLYEYTSDVGNSSGVLHSYPSYERSVNGYLLEETTGINISGTCLLKDYYAQSTTPLSVISTVPVIYQRVVSRKPGQGKTVSYFSGAAGGSMGFPYSPLTNKGLDIGDLKESKVYDEAGTLLQKQINTIGRHDFYPSNYTTSFDDDGRIFAINSGLDKIGNVYYDEFDYFLEPYYELSRDYLTDQQVKHVHYGSDKVIDSVSYYYDSNRGYLKTTTKFLEGTDSISTTNYYPYEVTSTTSLPGGALTTDEYTAIVNLKTDNRIGSPVQIDNSRKNTVIGRKRIGYKSWDTDTDGSWDIIAPETIKTSQNGGTLDTRVFYNQYSSESNPVEVSLPDGPSIVYIWGYNNLYPVAKIENATVSDIEALSSFGNDYDLGMNGLSLSQETDLRSLSDALVTTFEYDPMVGVISSTDPRGRTTYYHYDDFNRLEYVIDHDGNVLSKNQYNYRSN